MQHTNGDCTVGLDRVGVLWECSEDSQSLEWYLSVSLQMTVHSQKWNTCEKKGNRKNTVETSENLEMCHQRVAKKRKVTFICEFPHLDGDML